jgi:HK97 gp10 family phage protein
MDGFEKGIAEVTKAMQKLQSGIEADRKKFVTMACQEVERTAKSIMRDSPTNPAVSYGKKKHHPSLPYNPPSPDTGNLMRSVTHDIEVNGTEAVGHVGSIAKYAPYLEYGTSKMQPRPFLSTALIKCQSFISNLSREIFGK